MALRVRAIDTYELTTTICPNDEQEAVDIEP